jgi:hypothetical protein
MVSRMRATSSADNPVSISSRMACPRRSLILRLHDHGADDDCRHGIGDVDPEQRTAHAGRDHERRQRIGAGMPGVGHQHGRAQALARF